MRPSLPFRVIFVICHAGRPARYVWVIVRSVLKLFTLKPAETGVRPDVRPIIATVGTRRRRHVILLTPYHPTSFGGVADQAAVGGDSSCIEHRFDQRRTYEQEKPVRVVAHAGG